MWWAGVGGARQGQGRAGRPDIFNYAENNGFLAAIRIWEFRSPPPRRARAGQGRVGRAGTGQGGQTFSVTLRIMDFWPQSGFGNFDLLLLLLAGAGQGRGRGRGRVGRPDIFSYAENNRFLAAIRIWEFRSPPPPRRGRGGQAG